MRMRRHSWRNGTMRWNCCGNEPDPQVTQGDKSVLCVSGTWSDDES